jgi:hypothetical protein
MHQRVHEWSWPFIGKIENHVHKSKVIAAAFQATVGACRAAANTKTRMPTAMPTLTAMAGRGQPVRGARAECRYNLSLFLFSHFVLFGCR